MPGIPVKQTTPFLVGMHAATASTTGWIGVVDGGSECLFCGDPAPYYKPLHEGILSNIRKLWWCPPCETTWIV